MAPSRERNAWSPKGKIPHHAIEASSTANVSAGPARYARRDSALAVLVKWYLFASGSIVLTFLLVCQ